MSSKIYAILIGINDYPISPLKGCINDVLAVEKLLHSFQADASRLTITRLINEQATRDNIIHSFDLFRSSTEKDSCLLYFSGHGSHADAPPGFYSSTNRVHQSLVCWDSRRENGRDLMDKELAFLIWKYTTGTTKPPLVIITDCCNSGTVTRARSVREIQPMANNIPAPYYYGFHDCVNGEPGYVIDPTPDDGIANIKVQTGPHIHLAAARDDQAAREAKIEGEYHGLFTYSLLRILSLCNYQINYSELTKRAEIYLKSVLTDQVPVLSANNLPVGAAFKLFLQEERRTDSFANSLYYNASRGWCLDAGALQGVSKGDRVVWGGSFSTLITQVFLEESTVLSKPELRDISAQIPVTLLLRTVIKFRLDENVNLQLKQQLINALTQRQITELKIAADETADYKIAINASGVFVASFLEDTPIFKETPIRDNDAIVFFVDKLRRFSIWNRLLWMQNPNSSISAKDFILKLILFSGTGKYNGDDFAEINDLSQPILAKYFMETKPPSPAAFQLEFSNTSSQVLWFYTIAMGFDYSLDNYSFKVFTILPNSKTKLILLTKTGETDIIRLPIDNVYRDQGIFTITERLKIIVSNRELNYASIAIWQQQALESQPLTRSTSPRLKTRRSEKAEDYCTEDWTAITLSFVINYGEVVQKPE